MSSENADHIILSSSFRTFHGFPLHLQWNPNSHIVQLPEIWLLPASLIYSYTFLALSRNPIYGGLHLFLNVPCSSPPQHLCTCTYFYLGCQLSPSPPFFSLSQVPSYLWVLTQTALSWPSSDTVLWSPVIPHHALLYYCLHGNNLDLELVLIMHFFKNFLWHFPSLTYKLQKDRDFFFPSIHHFSRTVMGT